MKLISPHRSVFDNSFLTTLFSATLFVTSCSPATEGNAERLPPLRDIPEQFVIGADHHIHVQSETLIRSMDEVSNFMPPEFRDSVASLPPVDAAAIITELDAVDIEMAAVLSAAYIFEIPESSDAWSADTRRASSMAENDYAAAQVALYPDRLRLFCSVNPLTDYALAEITRCYDQLGATGLKLHFPTADIDLRNQEHLSQLNRVFTHAAQLEMPVLVHMATRDLNFGAVDVDNFINEVVVGNEHLELYLLHMAGWGSSGSDPHAALDAWISALNGGVLSGRASIYFEISGAYTRRLDNIRLAAQIEALGAERMLFGSDWPAILRPLYAAINFWTHVPLEAAVAENILDNRAPYFDD